MTIELPIGRSCYKITCGEGEEKKLLRLAENLNKRVNDLSLSLRGADEKMLLVIAALSLEEELEKISGSYDDEMENKLNDQDLYEAISDNMENITDYIEKLISKIQAY
jgi:cell division protein ZapA (FtsZ GTPase activity inhibitor)